MCVADHVPAGSMAPPAAASACDPAGEEALRQTAVRARAQRIIAKLDRAAGLQLDAVLHHPAFQRLEALWRGTCWLAESMTNDPGLQLRILDVRWGTLARDLERAPCFDQSHLFELVYGQEFGTAGGAPFGLMVVDHALWHHSARRDRIDDIAVLTGLAEVMAAAFCPLALGVDPRMIGLDDFGEIDLRQDIAASLTGTEFRWFERLRERPDARFLAAVLPRFLIRQPHCGRAMPRLGFVYDEQVEHPTALCWLSGGFALAQVAARAMRDHRWPATVRGAVATGEGGIVDAPERLFLSSDRRGTIARFPTENAISEEQEVALNAAGFCCLRQLHLTGEAAFLNLPTLHRPPAYEHEAARLNAGMGTMLNYILCVCRFAHYVKVLARDWVGRYHDAQGCEHLLQTWLNGFVSGNEDPSSEIRVRYPLREARVEVANMPNRPGGYRCVIAIRPHYQLDQIASEFKLTTVIGAEGSAA